MIAPRRTTHPSRRASAYLLVLFTVVIVSIVGLSALALSRVELKRNQQSTDAAAARAAARAGFDYALVRVRAETNWANFRSGGAEWAKDIRIGGAKFTLVRQTYDETDTLNPRLTFLSTGTANNATYQLRFTILRGAIVEQSSVAQVVN